MKRRKVISLVSVLLLSFVTSAFSKKMDSRKALRLLNKPTYVNGEADYYRVMKGGVLLEEELVIYTNISSNVLRVYLLPKDDRHKIDWPRDYTKSEIIDYYDIDLNTGSMIYHKMDQLPALKKNNMKGNYYAEYYYEGDTLILKMKDWDGTSSRERIQRMENINKEIPLFFYFFLL